MSTLQQRPVERPNYARENWALGLLSLGLVLVPPVGLVVGLYLATTSSRWNVRQKALVLVMPASFLILVLLVFGGVGSYSCVQAGNGPEVCDDHAPLALAWAVAATPVGLALLTAVYLFRAARKPL